MAARDEILGNDKSAKLRKADISQKSDFLIEGKIIAKYIGQQSLYGSLPQHVFSVGGELRALLPDTGEIVATVALPGTENIESQLDSKEMAARDVIQKVLASAGRSDGTPPLFNKILAKWVTETDLGAIKRIEFTGISNDDLTKIQTSLKETDKISSVWLREFDAQGLSVLDVETRLDNAGIQQKLSDISGGRVAVDRATENLISCKMQQAPEKKKSWWPW